MFFMPGQDDPEENEKQKEAAFDALKFFISRYSPAKTKEDAQEFYTTEEISQAVADHTGIRIKSPEIYELMTELHYSYDSFQGLDLYWLLKRD